MPFRGIKNLIKVYKKKKEELYLHVIHQQAQPFRLEFQSDHSALSVLFSPLYGEKLKIEYNA